MAVLEDIGTGDVTSAACIPESAHGSANVLIREAQVVCGQAAAELVARTVDPELRYHVLVADGQSVGEGDIIARLEGPLRSVLAAERTLLNLLQRLSGIASTTRELCAQVRGTNAALYDTRKTTPGLRELEKYAVRVGGGMNHRFGLYDAVLIKNNHVDAVGGDIALAISRCRQQVKPGMVVEVEVRDEIELRSALLAGPDIVLLDNMGAPALRAAVELRNQLAPTVLLEASGGITERNIRTIAETGVERISLGMLTHSVRSRDISLRLVRSDGGENSPRKEQ